jgi:cation diffusion facilitator CzcD-associated flavoprotein CzcO
MSEETSILIVGAGPAGLGIACALQERGIDDFVILERYEIGASFRRWPKETRFITPSFPARGYGVRDLNSICVELDPSEFGDEHPSGESYSAYLQAVARARQLPVLCGVEVQHIVARAGEGYNVITSRGEWQTTFLIWAGGEFQYPNKCPFPGAEYGIYSMSLSSYEQLKGASFLVIGGFESGVDVACHLVSRCARVRLIDAHPWWNITSPDPSCALSPVSRCRLREALKTGRLACVEGRVVNLTKAATQYEVDLADGRRFSTPTPPILATGFRGSLSCVEHLFDFDHFGHPTLTECDESTRSPGVFLNGPMIRRNGEALCFIYKFRSRQAIIAEAVASRLKGSLEHVRSRA